MPAKDRYHEAARQALETAGWTITHDPLSLRAEGVRYDIDLGAEQFITAQKENRRIAVEVKSFLRDNLSANLYPAVGQMLIYQEAVEHSEEEKDRDLYLAIPLQAYLRLEKVPLNLTVLKKHGIKLIVFRTQPPTIERWIE